MEKGINLTLPKSFFEFDKLLDQAVEAAQIKKLSTPNNIHGINTLKFCVRKYIQINYDKEDEGKYDKPEYFLIGFAWKEKKHEFCIVLEFDVQSSLLSSCKYTTGAERLTGTLGKYYSKVEHEYSAACSKSWIRFYLKNNYLKKFFDENIDKNNQLEILTGFINEVLVKCKKKYEQYINYSIDDLDAEMALFIKKLHKDHKKTDRKEDYSEFVKFFDIFNHEFFRNRDRDK